MIRHLAGDMAKYLPGVLVPALVGLAEVPILTRLFTPEAYGQYTLAITTILVLDLCAGWITLSLLRLYPAAEKNHTLPRLYMSVLLSAAAWIALLGAVLAAAVTLARGRMDGLLHDLLMTGCLVFMHLAFFHVLQHFLRASRRVGWYSAFTVWLNLARLAVGIVLVWRFGFGVEAFLYGYLASLLLALPFLLRVSLGPVSLARVSPSRQVVGEMARYGFPLVVCLLMDWVVSLSSVYFLRWYGSAQSVGIYAASQGVSAKALMLLTALFHTAALPLEMRIWEQDGPEQTRRFLRQVSRYFLIVSLPLAGLMSCLARPLVAVLTAPQYHEGFQIIPFVVLGGLLLGLQQRFQGGLLFRRKSVLVMAAFLASAACTVGLNLLLIPRWGYMGAAISVVGGYAVMLALMVAMSLRYFYWPFPFGTLLRVAAATLAMAGTLLALTHLLTLGPWQSLLVGVPVGGAVYVLVLLLLREVSAHEWQTLRKLVSRRGQADPAPLLLEERIGP